MDKYVEYFRCLGCNDRIKIINLLDDRELTPTQLQKHFNLEQSTVSYHINRLKKAGILTCRRDGKELLYRLSKGSLNKIFQEFMSIIS